VDLRREQKVHVGCLPDRQQRLLASIAAATSGTVFEDGASSPVGWTILLHWEGIAIGSSARAAGDIPHGRASETVKADEISTFIAR
jgi:hypothetical protein